MKNLIRMVLAACLAVSIPVYAEEQVARSELEQAQKDVAVELTILVQTYLPLAGKMVGAGEGVLKPFLSFLTTEGEVGFQAIDAEFDGSEAVLNKMVATLYSHANENKEKWACFGIFAVTTAEKEGESVEGITALLEHKTGVALQRFWPFEMEEGGQKVTFLAATDAYTDAVVYK